MLNKVNWIFLVLAAFSLFLAVERTLRLKEHRATVNHRAMNVALITLGVAASAYGTMMLTAAFYNFGLALWHGLLGILIGALEVIVLTLRFEQIPLRTLRRAQLRSGLVTLVLFSTWPSGFAWAPPISDLTKIDPPNPAVIFHIAVFHLYIIWGLLQLLRVTFSRVPREFGRRPISAIALIMVGLGCIGFIGVNVDLGGSILIGVHQEVAVIRAPTGTFLGLCVGGAGLLGFGERIWTAIIARYRLWQLSRLWEISVKLSTAELRFLMQLPATAKMQRAYIEISDALSTLRIDTDRQLTVKEVAALLLRGETTEDRSAPTVSQALPPRTTRLEDLHMIHALARECRRGRSGRHTLSSTLLRS
ncbi:hypothetical protein [Arthrobacter bambusae]|uniref:Uncharacterized protein n=1 Tax=Arthrobacter bambusae TaxID=1338426 RepID=A0AAW8D8Y4_9MICC|nr:hypothetical protein [Arthrobacter bambusae]MDP9904747.1 hypothetical protein [Arthrobacter bambusae]MDQ0129563.1 hypothetical protein [Arthrobacter bambusae]MDQ0180824.1 hypothetical protein [Arthrobacter bambusae]